MSLIINQEKNKLKELLQSSKTIAIIPHRNPDGDALGASLGLYHVLKNLKYPVKIISPNAFPNFLKWMPSTQEILIFEENTDQATTYLKACDLIFTLDFNALHRTGELMSAALEKLTQPFVMIDHHQMPDSYAKATFSDPSYGSTCELLYKCLEALELTNAISKEAATCFYTGIVTDSGSFRFAKTTSNTHRVVANLIDKGIDNPEIHNQLFNNSSYNRLQLLGRALQNLKIIENKKTAYIVLSQKDLDEFHFEKGDTEGIVNYALSIKGIKLAAIFIENSDEKIVKISFRSEGNVDVNAFARNHFKGGGHINAAGGKSLDNLHDTVEKFIEIIQNETIC